MSDNQIKNAALTRQRILEALAAAEGLVLTNQDLYAMYAINEVAKDANQVSVILSELNRTGQIKREPYIKAGTNIKFAYKYNPDSIYKPHTHGGNATASGPVKFIRPVPTTTQPKPEITVTDDLVTIVMANVRITVQLKGVK